MGRPVCTASTSPRGEVGFTELEHVRVYAFTGRRHSNMPPAPRDPEELAALEEKWKERAALEKRLRERAEMDRERRRPARELAAARDLRR
jgi:molecular chaperone GrpE (heat shock protein)